MPRKRHVSEFIDDIAEGPANETPEPTEAALSDNDSIAEFLSEDEQLPVRPKKKKRIQ
jgi:hypothetical protein